MYVKTSTNFLRLQAVFWVRLLENLGSSANILNQLIFSPKFLSITILDFLTDFLSRILLIFPNSLKTTPKIAGCSLGETFGES